LGWDFMRERIVTALDGSPVEEESGKRRGSGDWLGVRLGRRGGARANEANGAQASYSER
jgi:hypothetical protein